MPCFLAQPSTKAIREFVARQSEKPFSYSEVGYSRDFPPRGYVVDHRRICLGKGLATFEAACAALRSWEMFNLGWVRICWPDTRLVPGSTVAVLARCFGLWWLNACRIIYVIDESSAIRKFGFAYGTLPEHVERGEERFAIEWHDDDSVWYDLFAFSQPAKWFVRLGYPLARRLQKRFGKDSLVAMARAIQDSFPGSRMRRSS